jgi:hypothetical protein
MRTDRPMQHCPVRCSTVPGRVTGGRRGWRAAARRRRR